MFVCLFYIYISVSFCVSGALVSVFFYFWVLCVRTQEEKCTFGQIYIVNSTWHVSKNKPEVLDSVLVSIH